MAVKYSDKDIAMFLKERKSLPGDYRNQICLKQKRGHKERELDVNGASGNQFRLILRQSDFNPFDFSIIVALCAKDTNQVFRLRRYNGKHGEHTNSIEEKTFYDFHIHMATERYQELGSREDAYAEATARFSDFRSALRCALEDGGFEVPKDPQLSLFEEV